MQLGELINDFIGNAQPDADDYLNIENQVMNDDTNAMSPSFSNESEVDTDIPKQIHCSKALVSTEVSILFFQQQPEDKSHLILDITRLQKHRYLNF